MTDESDWREGRRDAAFTLADALAKRQAAESAEAAGHIAKFVAKAEAAGLAPVPLKAKPYSGRSPYRTDIVGWYLRRDHTIGVSVDGGYYILKVPDSFAASIRGARIAPSPPPMIVGAGGRDGDSIDLPKLLAQRLAAGQDF